MQELSGTTNSGKRHRGRQSRAKKQQERYQARADKVAQGKTDRKMAREGSESLVWPDGARSVVEDFENTREPGAMDVVAGDASRSSSTNPESK